MVSALFVETNGCYFGIPGVDAWVKYGIAAPRQIGWNQCLGGYWVCEVWQAAYGHKARKRTWLLYCGDNPPPELKWERPEGSHQIGGYDQRGKKHNKPTIGGKAASATPPEFRTALLHLAANAQRTKGR